MRKYLLVLIVVMLMPNVGHSQTDLPTVGRCMNLGNALEASVEGTWGYSIQAEHIHLLAETGFDTLRIPIKWSAHTDEMYTIDPAFFARVDEVIGWVLANNMNAIINIHHFNELIDNPAGETEHFWAIWDQIATRYREQPRALMFELLNEPNGDLDVERWNTLALATVQRIRAIDPDRVLILGGANWNNLSGLLRLELPADTTNLIATVHYYDPFLFTHQGAEWVEPNPPTGIRWGRISDIEALEADLQQMADWRAAQGVPLFIGEFGAYFKAEMGDRAAYTRALTRRAERHGLGWCYWEFAAGFGVYDQETDAWRSPLIRALMPDANAR